MMTDQRILDALKDLCTAVDALIDLAPECGERTEALKHLEHAKSLIIDAHFPPVEQI